MSEEIKEADVQLLETASLSSEFDLADPGQTENIDIDQHAVEDDEH